LVGNELEAYCLRRNAIIDRMRLEPLAPFRLQQLRTHGRRGGGSGGLGDDPEQKPSLPLRGWTGNSFATG
jgi:hypothetical protein